LRDDQSIAKAEIALIVSSALPRNVEAFDAIDNLWKVEPRFAVPLAIASQQSLIEVAGTVAWPGKASRPRWGWSIRT
jgi:hypothetical protein